ncbi:hypothetical protein ACFQ4O_01765 [Methylopila musalis]|uniref:Uncharacterized protein n=1 Tax=Methylopila musalis TaxID=1134781 RepID=A0ABW3Z394_9HYPH
MNPPLRLRQAISVEDLLIWAYREKQIDRAMARMVVGNGPSGFHASGVWRLGARVEGGPARFGLSLDDDAVRVHAAVSWLAVLEPEAAALIVRHARTATEPEWHGREAERLAPLRRGGRVCMELDARRRAVACRVVPLVDPGLVRFGREQWTRWRAGLVLIARELRGALWSYEVARCRPMMEPWKSGARGTAFIAVDEAA